MNDSLKPIGMAVENIVQGLSDKIMVETGIPFTGFYESIHSEAIDYALEDTFRYNDRSDSAVPYESTHFDLTSVFGKYAQEFVEAFFGYVKAETGQDFNAEFSGMESPKYYNFETDRLFVKVPLTVMVGIFDEVKDSGEFRGMIEARHSSYSGFHSFYSNDVTEWLAKPIQDYGHNEYMTVLLAWLDKHGLLHNDRPIIDETALIEDWHCDGAISDWVWQALTPDQKLFADIQRQAGRELDMQDMLDNPEYKDYLSSINGTDLTVIGLEEFLKTDKHDLPYRCLKTLELPL